MARLSRNRNCVDDRLTGRRVVPRSNRPCLSRRLVIGMTARSTRGPASAWTARLATVLRADIIAVHAIEAAACGIRLSATPAGSQAELAWGTRQDEGCGLLRSAGASFTSFIEYGSPSDVLVRVAEEEDADAIIIGAPRRRSFLRASTGTTARRLRAAASMPVIVVPDDLIVAPSASLQIAVAIGDLDTDHPALTWAVHLAVAIGGRLHVVHTVDPAADRVGQLEPKQFAAALEHARRRLEAEVFRAAQPVAVDAQVDILVGQSPRMFFVFVEHEAVDLVVLTGASTDRRPMAEVLDDGTENRNRTIPRSAVAVVRVDKVREAIASV